MATTTFVPCRLWTLPLVAAGVLVAGATGAAADPEELSAKLKLSVARGLRHLIESQSASGEFDSEFPVAAGGLAGLALLSSGADEVNGPPEYATALRNCTTALLRRQKESGYIDDGSSRMYGHGFATLYLAQLYGTTSRQTKEIRSALRRALELIETSQSRDGGWDYTPNGKGTPTHSPAEGIFGDTSITVCQTMALRAGKNLGLRVDPLVVARAGRYIAKAQNPDGGFRYRPHRRRGPGNESAFARSAAGACILYSLGMYRSESIKSGFDYLSRTYASSFNRFPYYGHYYCSQAMFQAGGRHWREYFQWVSQHLIANQEADGGWPESRQELRVQCTAMALIVLQLPGRLLPIHER